MSTVSFGFSVSWPSSTIPKLQSADDRVNPLGNPLTTVEISTLAALPSVAGCLGLYFTPLLTDNLGRKSTLVTISTVVVLSMLSLAFAREIYLYYISLFVNGFCTSCLMAVVSVYNTEITDNNNRGRINCLMGASVPFGAILVYLSGSASVRTICIVGTITPAMFLVLSIFLPETPMYLLTSKKDSECLKALQRLRGTKNVEEEYLQMKRNVRQSDSKKCILDVFKTRASIRSFGYTMELLMTQTFSGIFVLGAFMGPIFDEAGAYLTGNAIGVLAGVVQIVFVVVASLFVERLGRKPLLFASMGCCVGCLAVLSVYFYLKSLDSMWIERVKWLPVIIVIMYYISYSVGVGPVPFALACELFSNELRAVGFSTALILSNAIIFVTLFAFPLISEAFGVHVNLVICCVLSVIVGFLIHRTVPETRGKSLNEIQKILSD
ncbi:unnamed protein product [Phyllotreta striolata]|uniref:Major facilitator superfamily (MFS) profile domain-containing protein n=1 Tax=Phyllotreta striolata TaxID=444603 RepID=A0A9N9TKF5_PHYSR|nr:unnamed protein product [Phyllotreta striolata]